MNEQDKQVLEKQNEVAKRVIELMLNFSNWTKKSSLPHIIRVATKFQCVWYPHTMLIYISKSILILGEHLAQVFESSTQRLGNFH